MDVKDIDLKIAELQAMRERLEAEEIKKRQAEYFQEARVIYTRLVEDLRRLGEIGYVPERLLKVLTDQRGNFNPGQYIKRPRAPSEAPEDEAVRRHS